MFSTLDQDILALDQEMLALDQEILALDQEIVALDQESLALDQDVLALDQEIENLAVCFVVFFVSTLVFFPLPFFICPRRNRQQLRTTRDHFRVFGHNSGP